MDMSSDALIRGHLNKATGLQNSYNKDKKWNSHRILNVKSHIQSAVNLEKARRLGNQCQKFLRERGYYLSKAQLIFLVKLLSHLLGLERDRESVRVGTQAMATLDIFWDRIKPYMETLSVSQKVGDWLTITVNGTEYSYHRNQKQNIEIPKMKTRSRNQTLKKLKQVLSENIKREKDAQITDNQVPENSHVNEEILDFNPSPEQTSLDFDEFWCDFDQ